MEGILFFPAHCLLNADMFAELIHIKGILRHIIGGVGSKSLYGKGIFVRLVPVQADRFFRIVVKMQFQGYASVLFAALQLYLQIFFVIQTLFGIRRHL